MCRLAAMKWPALWIVCSVSIASGCARENVVRIFDGREVHGRWVSPEAYAAFTEAALQEARGNRGAAVAAYERAIAEDPENAAAWGRIGALRCTEAPAAADRAFSRAEALDSELEAPWMARAECALERRDAQGAVSHSLRAAALAPDDDEASLLVATALERSGDALAARRWRRALALGSELPEEAYAAKRAKSSDALERAFQGDTAELERAAIAARIGSAELSLRAVQHGRTDLANRFSSLVLEADPASSDARIAALSSADLEKDQDSFNRLSKNVPRLCTPPSALGAVLMEALIGRRLGPEAARAWASAYRAIVAP
jgi:tetratricopeptide (TPR) repeat protein